MKAVWIKNGREKSVLRKHPWIFSGAVKKVSGNPENGDLVEILNSKDSRLGIGFFSGKSQITVRMLCFDNENLEKDFLQKRIRTAVELRTGLSEYNTEGGVRLVFSESDNLPGLIADKYANLVVLQFLTAGMDLRREEIAGVFSEIFPDAVIYERSDSDSRGKEGLKPATGFIKGSLDFPLVEIIENGIKILVDYQSGHKTGFYLDQSSNRKKLSEYSKGRTILNCFSYSGGFGLAALKGGAEIVVNADSSKPALDLADKNFIGNGFEKNRYELCREDVFALLRKYSAEGRKFDIVILDPPKFADSAHSVNKAARGYKDIAMLAFKILNPGGYLFNFSCSGHISAELFQKITADAALDAGRNAQIVEYMTQAADHPVSLNFPEALYLKGLVCRVIN